jgi:hypothetical protein
VEPLKSEDIVVKDFIEDDREKYLLITDTNNLVMSALQEQFASVLTDMKLTYDIIDVEKFIRPSENYDVHVFVLKDLSQIRNLEEVFDFIADGGHAIFPYSLEFNDFFSGVYRLLGITEHGEFESVTGLNISNVYMFGVDNITKEMTQMIENVSISVQLNQDAQVLISADNSLSLAWSYQHGQGNIAYFNGTILHDKKYRSLLVGLINSIRYVKIYPIINSQVQVINAIPSPIPQGNNQVIFDDYKRSTLRFYKEIWWPDMVEMSSRFNKLYSGGLLASYDSYDQNNLAEAFLIKKENLSIFGRELLNAQGEIALNGFNRLPLVVGEDWVSEDEIIEAILYVENLFNEIFVEYPLKSVIASSKTMSPSILEKLVDQGYLVFASFYYGKPGEFSQSFSIGDGYIEHPMITHGYQVEGEKMWTLYNSIVSQGIISHSFSFDDIFDESRSENLKWKGMYEGLYDFYDLLDNHYVWLDNLRLSDSARRVLNYRNLDPVYKKTSDRLIITDRNSTDEAYFVLYEEDEILSIAGGEVVVIEDNYYLIKMVNKVVEIVFER